MSGSAQRASRKQRERKILLEVLRELRKQRNLTQDQLAKSMGVKQAFVSKYEQGERRIDMLELKTICDAIKLPLTEFARRFEEGCK